MNKIVVVGLLLTSFSSFAKIEIKNKGTDNNCDVRIFKTRVSKEWNARKGMKNRVSLSLRSIPLYAEDYLSKAGFNPILAPEGDYLLKEGDIFIESSLSCRDIGEATTWWKCYGNAEMYIRTNGLSLKVASAKGSEGESFELAETGISNLPVECK